MRNLKRRLRRIEKAAREHVACIELEDGSRYNYDAEQTAIELFLYLSDCLRAQYAGRKRAAPPEVIHAVAKAKNREAALRQLYSGGRVGHLPLEVDALIERGEFVHRSLVASPPES
jgi:hypothetical protein